MDKQKEIVMDFLRQNQMDCESIDMDQSCKAFIKEMESGLEGESSSLKMIPTYITMDRDIPIDEPVIVMDAGGTNFRVAVVYFDKDRKPVIEDFKLYPMPGTKGEISKLEFFTTIARYIEPVLNRSKKIGFCFSYATETLPNKDGRMMQFSKEVRVKDLIGEVVGENLLNTLKDMGLCGDKKIVMLNDTVATLLGGKAAYADRVFDSYIGFILGTGTNACYFEENNNIKKVAEIADKEGSMIINMESGGYGKAERSVVDIEFDNGTVNPGEYSFEKMISGRYQGGMLLALIKKAVKDGLFSEQFCEKINNINEITSEEISDFLYYPYSANKLSMCCYDSSPANKSGDHLVLYYLIDSIIERAAKLVTINIASIIIKTGSGKNPCAPVCVTAEGATFYKSKLFKSKLEYYVKKYLNDEKELFCEFVKAEDATLIGAAIAGLLN